MLNKYIDNELSAKDKEYIEAHLTGCSYCRSELKSFMRIKEALGANKIKSDPQNFWEMLTPRLKEEDVIIEKEDAFSFNIGLWSKRLMPVPVVIAASVIILLNLNFTNRNLVDEYIFGASFNKTVSLLNDNSAGLGL